MLSYEALRQARDYGADRMQGDIWPFQDWRDTCELDVSAGPWHVHKAH